MKTGHDDEKRLGTAIKNIEARLEVPQNFEDRVLRDVLAVDRDNNPRLDDDEAPLATPPKG